MKTFILFLAVLSFSISYAQVGIGTTNPQGALDINSSNMGLVIPRVTALEDVTNADGSTPAVNGTVVYDLSRDKECRRINNVWVCTSVDPNTGVVSEEAEEVLNTMNSLYFKASNTDAEDDFATRVAISDDGNTIVAATEFEDSNATGVNGDQSNNSASNSGAAYVFFNDGTAWVQQAYLKASNTGTNDGFGNAVAISGNGDYIAIGADSEDSNATGINGDGSNNSALSSGAVYVFHRVAGTWTQQAYIKSSNSEQGDIFGRDVGLNNTGDRLVVTANREDSAATGINGDQTNNSVIDSGAAYVFERTGTNWTQTAYIKASNTQNSDFFGSSCAISGDGNYIAIGANAEDSNATGINGDETNNAAFSAGAVYLFFYNGTNWSQQAYVKASNTDTNDSFGGFVLPYRSLDLSFDGSRLAVGARGEDSNATGINGDEANNTGGSSGAVYVFNRTGSSWAQEAYIKASNTGVNFIFGATVALNNGGDRLVVGSIQEGSDARGLNGDQSNTNAGSSGAVYGFERVGTTWTQVVYIKSSNSETGDYFGRGLCINGDGSLIFVGAEREDSNATGIGGDQFDNSSNSAGAGYLITPF